MEKPDDAARAFRPGTLDADAHQVLMSPIPIFLAMRIGYLRRAFSAKRLRT
jgi:hypothetical protein